MSDTLRLIDHPLVATLGWTLTHFVWQGAVLGLIAFFILRVMRPSRASTRYLVGVATLLAMLVAPVATFLTTINQSSETTASWRPAAITRISSAGMVTGSMFADVAANPSAARRLMPPAAFESQPIDAAPIAPVWLPIVTAVWMLGVAVLSMRMLGGWILTQSLARRAVSAVSPGVEAAAQKIARRLELQRRVAVFESAAVAVPTLVGWVKPVVLLPAAALAGLTPMQLEAVIAHELAHVRRHDFLINLLQSLVETLLFYHPAVWWVSSDVRAEREHCCDDLAVAVCGDRLVYVSALAELTSIERRAFALAATDGSLVKRVRRILGRPVDARKELPPSWGVLALLVMIGGGAGTYEMTTAAADIEQVAQVAAEARLPNAARSEARTRDAQERFASETIAPLPPSSAQQLPFNPFADVLLPPPAPPAAPAPPVPSTAPPALAALPARLAPPALLIPEAPRVPEAPRAPEVGTIPESPAVLQIPAPPAPPAPPVPPAPLSDVSVTRGEGSFSWSNNGERLAVRWTGPFRLSDDERDITWIEEGAKVTIADGWVFTDRIELRGLAGGQVERKFFRSGFERDYEAEGRSFLSNAIQRMIRSGMFASDRVARFLKQGGPDLVLAEIDRLQSDSSYLKRVYYSALLKQADLSPQQLTRVLEHVGTTVRSDYEKATLLVQVVQEPNATDQQRLEVTRATRSISSGYEQRKVLSAVLKVAPMSAAIAAAAIDVSSTISSSHDRSQILMQLAQQGAVTTQTSPAFMGAVSSMSSSYDQRKVLAALAESPGLPEAVTLESLKTASSIASAHDKRQVLSAHLAQSSSSPKVAAAALASAATIASGHDKSEVLMEVINRGGVTDETASSFFTAAETISSSHDLSRTLTALIDRGKLSDGVLAGVLRAAKRITSSHDRSTLLLRVLRNQTLSPANRQMLLDAAEGIASSSEQNSVLAALVRSERR